MAAIDYANDSVNAAFLKLEARAAASEAIPPVPTLTAPAATSEGNSGTTNFAFTVTLNKVWNTALTYRYDVTGNGSNPMSASDFVGGAYPSGTITIPAGSTQGVINISVAGDTTIEPDETFLLQIYPPSISATGTVLNDDTTPTLPAYSGQVATRSAPANGTLQQSKLMSRVQATTTDAWTGPRIKLPGWFVDGNDASYNIGSAITYTASLEYPAGTFTQVKWGGSASVVAPIGGDTGLSDAISISIPKGTQVWWRIFASTTANGMPVNIVQGTAALGDACVADGSATDMTMGGTISGAPNNILLPSQVLQSTTLPTFGFIGNSRTEFNTRSQSAGPVGTKYGWINVAKSGSKLADFINSGTLRRQLLSATSHIAHSYGINDLTPSLGNRSAAAVQADMIAAAYAFPDKTHVISTISPYTTGAWSASDLSDQTVFGGEAQRAAFNTWARSVPDPFVACVDTASAVESGSTGKWKAGYTDDGLHQNDTGFNAILSANVFNADAIAAKTSLRRWSPLQYARVNWWDGANASKATSDSQIGPVLAGNSLTSSGGATRTATGWNGGPGYDLTGGGYLYSAGSDVSRNATSLYLGVLWTPSANPGGAAGIAGYTTSGSNSAPRAMIMQNASGMPGLAIRRLDGDALVTAYGTTALTPGTPYLLSATFDPANGVAKLYVNGVLAVTANYSSTGATSDTQAGFAVIGFLGGKSAVGTFREFIGFNATAAVSDAERQKMEGSMAWRSAVNQTLLPSGHPNYSTRPVL